MESNLLAVIAALVAAAIGAVLTHLWSRTRPSRQDARVAELEAQLVAAREQSNRYGVQAAGLERDVETLRSQLYEVGNRAAAFEERARHADELRALVREREQAIERLNGEASQ